MADTVNARGIFFGGLRVALLAIGGLRAQVVVGMLRFDVGVATDAGVRPVRGVCELGLVHKQRDFPARRVCAGQGLVRVALKATAVFQSSQS